MTEYELLPEPLPHLESEPQPPATSHELAWAIDPAHEALPPPGVWHDEVEPTPAVAQREDDDPRTSTQSGPSSGMSDDPPAADGSGDHYGRDDTMSSPSSPSLEEALTMMESTFGRHDSASPESLSPVDQPVVPGDVQASPPDPDPHTPEESTWPGTLPDTPLPVDASDFDAASTTATTAPTEIPNADSEGAASPWGNLNAALETLELGLGPIEVIASSVAPCADGADCAPAVSVPDPSEVQEGAASSLEFPHLNSSLDETSMSALRAYELDGPSPSHLEAPCETAAVPAIPDDGETRHATAAEHRGHDEPGLRSESNTNGADPAEGFSPAALRDDLQAPEVTSFDRVHTEADSGDTATHDHAAALLHHEQHDTQVVQHDLDEQRHREEATLQQHERDEEQRRRLGDAEDPPHVVEHEEPDAVGMGPASNPERNGEAHMSLPETSPAGILAAEHTRLEVEQSFDQMVDPAGYGSELLDPPTSAVYTASSEDRALYETLREEFNRSLRGLYAVSLGLAPGDGGQVHHAIELGVVTRYGPDIFRPDELNGTDNMRGIPPERSTSGELSATRGRKQLHNSAIRDRWDRAYDTIDREVSARGLAANSPEYRTFVREQLQFTRQAIDDEVGMFFSESRRTLAWALGALEADAATWQSAVTAAAGLSPPR